MQELPWLESHLGSIENAVEVAKDFTWKLEIVEHSGRWYVKDGDEAVIFAADKRENMEAFIYGLGLAYTCLPEDLYEKLKQDINDWYKNL